MSVTRRSTARTRTRGFSADDEEDEMNIELHKFGSRPLRSRLVFVIATVLAFAGFMQGQTPDPSPSPDMDRLYNGYKVISTSEIGWRFRSLEGNENKYKSDLNYEPGFRTFDSSLFMSSDSGTGKYFDALLVNFSGWGSDPSGMTRVNVEKTGVYKFLSNVRKVKYFNNLSSFIGVADPNQHTQDAEKWMTDFDFTLLPQNEKIRFNFGVSTSDYSGPGTWNMRWQSDEFKVDSDNDYRSTDIRFGAEGKLLGFDWSIVQGLWNFRDSTELTITSLNEGHAVPPGNITRVSNFYRLSPTDGRGSYTNFNIHRTFANRFDFTGRLIYSSAISEMNLTENVVGNNNTAGGQIFDADTYLADTNARRPQFRGDLGVTYRITEAFRLSNTFMYDRFSNNGGNFYRNDVTSRNANGTPRPVNPSITQGYAVHDYSRYINTFEGDYQFNRYVSLHLGHRYSNRETSFFGYSFNAVNPNTNPQLACPPPTLNPNVTCQDAHTNTTSTFLAGMRIKPLKPWTIYWDMEIGTADSIFGRLENNDFNNLRIRSIYRINNFSFDVSYITRDNSNPSSVSAGLPVPAGYDPLTEVKSRTFSGNVTWDPMTNFNIAAGYTYRHLDSETPVYVPYQVCSTPACTAGTTVRNVSSSEYLARDHYGYVEVSAEPHRRFGLYGAFRMNKDNGQGDRTGTLVPNPFPVTGIPVYSNWVDSYPMSFITPEAKVVIRLTRSIDWNIGYQYYKYDDDRIANQNYRAHLPYTSLRIYFGNGAADR